MSKKAQQPIHLVVVFLPAMHGSAGAATGVLPKAKVLLREYDGREREGDWELMQGSQSNEDPSTRCWMETEERPEEG